MVFDTLTWHYSATFEDQDIGAAEIDAMHKARGWSGIGYHFVVRMDGRIEAGRPLTKIGSHVRGQNKGNLGCVYIGGLRRATGVNVGFDTRTNEQKSVMVQHTLAMLTRFPTIQRVVGHRDLAATQCPGFDVRAWWAGVATGTPVAPRPVNPAAPAISYPPLRAGSRGPAVRALQEALLAQGVRLALDGAFGPETRAAVLTFQALRGLVADGKVDPSTWAALLGRS